MTIVITGGTGSFGSALAKHLLATTDQKITILDRSEAKLLNMQRELNNSRLTFIMADIRDRERLEFTFRGADVVYHAAALKQAPLSQIYSTEFVKTNIGGTLNVIAAAGKAEVGRVLFISSDKATAPLNNYGKCKAVAEGIIVEANMIHPQTRFASVRGGNVWGSRGSVVDRWLAQDPIEMTNPDSTRFHLPMRYWMTFCVRAVDEMRGGEIFIPKCRAWRLGTLAEAFQQHFWVGINHIPPRDGDKLHEMLISGDEAGNAINVGWAFVIQPSISIREVWNYQCYDGIPLLAKVSSDGAPLMTVDELRTAIVNGG